MPERPWTAILLGATLLFALLLARTYTLGVHFEDHLTLMQAYDFPEWSHMSRSSAERYTAELYRVLEQKHPLADGRRW